MLQDTFKYLFNFIFIVLKMKLNIQQNFELLAM